MTKRLYDVDWTPTTAAARKIALAALRAANAKKIDLSSIHREWCVGMISARFGPFGMVHRRQIAHVWKIHEAALRPLIEGAEDAEPDAPVATGRRTA